jgi:hypothetical protein
MPGSPAADLPRVFMLQGCDREVLCLAVECESACKKYFTSYEKPDKLAMLSRSPHRTNRGKGS